MGARTGGRQPKTERRRQMAQVIGAKIRQRRESLGWSQEDLARRCGELSLGTVGNVERGKGLPDMETLHVIAKTLDVPSALPLDPLLKAFGALAENVYSRRLRLRAAA